VRYRITFRERTNAAGEPSENPPEYLDAQAAEGVILDKAMVQRDEPAAVHNEEGLEEDDDIMSIGSETWDYEVADKRQQEFLDAALNSRVVMECIPLDSDAE